MERPNWREYFLDILHAVQNRASCDRGRSGAIIIKNKHVLTTGYVGSPPGASHCDESGHDMDVFYRPTDSNKLNTFTIEKDQLPIGSDPIKLQKEKHCIRTVHAEQNAIAQAAKLGVSIDAAAIYCTMFPCYSCAKLIIASGITHVVAEYDYQSSAKSKELFDVCKIGYKIINEKELY